jgi:hypothetical protein
MRELTDMQSILGLTSEQRNILSRTDFTISGTGSMTEHGIPSVELQEELYTQVSWLPVEPSIMPSER